MAGSSNELGFPNSQHGRSLREKSAINTLRNVRKSHPYVELREDNKKPIFFCVLCLSPCNHESVLKDHLRGHLHKKQLEAAKSTLLKENPWPFNDGMLFFHTPCNENSSLPTSNPSSLADDDKKNVDDNGYDLIVPHVLRKDGVTDLEVKSIGLGRVAVRFYQKDGVTKGISRIWCEWLGDCHLNQDNTTPYHDFAILSFPYYYAMGRKNSLDKMLCLLSSDPEDVSESLSKSSGKEYLASVGSSSEKVIPSRSERKELREYQKIASKRVCDICQHKILPGKDVATLLNMKTGRLACSSRNLIGAFHVFHISCLIRWILFCDYEVYTKQLVDLKVDKQCRKKGAKNIEAENEVKKQIYCVFCPDCQGTGIDIDGDELEKTTASLYELYKYKMKACDGHREYRKNPEMLQNCSTGFRFPPESEEPMQENVSALKMLRFYRAVE